MPLEHLLAALEREAHDRADALLGDARAEAERLGRAADAALARRRAEALQARAAEFRAAAEVSLGAARRVNQAALLGARHRLVNRVFERTRALFPDALASEAYRTALPGHLTEALAALGNEPAVIRCAESLAPDVRQIIAHRANVTVVADPTAPPGLTVTTPDGSIEVDNTLAGRLERLRLELSLEIISQVEPSA